MKWLILMSVVLGVSLIGCGSVQANGHRLEVTTVSLPATTVGVPYSQQLQAQGGTGIYSWALVSGSLPPGINLSSSGLLSGTPSGTGKFSFTVRVVDSKFAAVEVNLETKG